LEPITFWLFVARSLGRAAVKSADFFELRIRTAVIAVALVALGFLLFWRVRGVAETKEEVYKYLTLVAAPTVLFLAALFICNLFRAPYLIYLDEHGREQAKVAQADAARRESDGKVTMLEAKVSQLEKQLSAKSPPASNRPRSAAEAAKPALGSLTDGQRYLLKRKLAEIKGESISIELIGHDPQMRITYEQLSDIFSDSGWKVERSEVGQVGVVGVNFPDGPYMTSTNVAAPIVKQLFSVFSSVGINFPLVPDAYGTKPTGHAGANVVIVIH